MRIFSIFDPSRIEALWFRNIATPRKSKICIGNVNDCLNTDSEISPTPRLIFTEVSKSAKLGALTCQTSKTNLGV